MTKVNIDFSTLTTAKRFVHEELEENSETSDGEKVEEIKTISFDHPAFKLGNKHFKYYIKEKIEKGDRIYISGKSGSGKSSLLKVLLKFRVATGVKVNSLPLASLENESLRQRISYLSQTTTILTTTIEENIGLGKKLSEAQKEQLNASHLLDSLWKDKDWTTVLTENGSNLSGGERQRIAVARLLLTEADVYILDESTSSIDDESAMLIFETVSKLAEDKILIYTSHDVRQQEYATKIIKI